MYDSASREQLNIETLIKSGGGFGPLKPGNRLGCQRQSRYGANSDGHL